MKKLILIIFAIIFIITPNRKVCKAEENARDIPIIMYHSVLENKSGNYCVTPEMLKEDIEYLKNHGYEPIFIEDIINFCEGEGTLPKKPVVISFDDGYFNNYYYAYPIIKEEDFKANLNVIGGFCDFSTTSGDSDNLNYSYLTWKEIKELHDSNLFEIGNHTYKMHNFKPRFGIKKKADESENDYKLALEKDILWLENKLKNDCGFNTQVFAYPFGEYNDEGEKILRDLGFKAFLTCNEGINKVRSGDTKVLSHLKRINRTGLLSTKEFFKKYNIF